MIIIKKIDLQCNNKLITIAVIHVTAANETVHGLTTVAVVKTVPTTMPHDTVPTTLESPLVHGNIFKIHL